MNYYNVDAYDVARVVNEIPEGLLKWVVQDIPYNDRNRKAFIYDNSKNSGHIVSSKSTEWKKNIPVALSSTIHKEPKCKRIAYIIMPEVDGGVTTFVCDCPNQNDCCS